MMSSISLIAGTMCLSAIAFGQCKTAIVNFREVTLSNDGKTPEAKFDARVAEWKVKIDAIQREVSAAQTKLQEQSQTASQASINELNRTITQKQRELQSTLADAQRDVDSFRESLLAPDKKALEIAKEIAAERGITTVLDSSFPTTNLPIDANTNCNITAEVKAKMKANSSGADATDRRP